MEKKSSDIWNHFSVINNQKAKCSYCSNPISYKGGSTTNLTKHLKRKHYVQYEARKIPRLEMVEQNLDEHEPDKPNEKRPQTSQPQTLSCQPSTTTNINTKKNTPITNSSRFIYYETDFSK